MKHGREFRPAIGAMETRLAPSSWWPTDIWSNLFHLKHHHKHAPAHVATAHPAPAVPHPAAVAVHRGK